MKKQTVISTIIASTLAVAALIVGYSQRKELFLYRNNLANKSVVEIVNHLEDKLDENKGFNAGITGEGLILSDAFDQIELPLPDGLFYLSVAPYINQSHRCSNHSLITCRGELKNQTFRIQITDLDANTITLDQDLSSSSNGFIGVWLPANKSYDINVSYNSLTSTTYVTTSKTSYTCLTTMKLT